MKGRDGPPVIPITATEEFFFLYDYSTLFKSELSWRLSCHVAILNSQLSQIHIHFLFEINLNIAMDLF